MTLDETIRAIVREEVQKLTATQPEKKKNPNDLLTVAECVQDVGGSVKFWETEVRPKLNKTEYGIRGRVKLIRRWAAEKWLEKY